MSHISIDFVVLLDQITEAPFGELKEPGAPNDNFRKIICSEDDLRSRIFGSFSEKFLACLPLLEGGVRGVRIPQYRTW